MQRVGPTLVYDFEVLADGKVPVDVAKNISVPTRVMVGEKSVDFMHTTADKLRDIIPDSHRKILKDQSHEVSPEAMAQELNDFFAEEGSAN